MESVARSWTPGSRLRRTLWIGGALAGLALPEPARAQYRIEADGCGPQPAAISTTEPDVARLGGATSQETGSYIQCSSSASGTNGALAASTTASFTGGTIGLMPISSNAQFREQIWIDGLGAGETFTLEAHLDALGAADVGGASGSAVASATLNVGGCRITRSFRSTGAVTDTANCSWPDSQAVGGPDGLSVFLTIPYGSIGPSPLGNYVQIWATLVSEVSSLSPPGVGLAEIGGQLGVAGAGDATLRFSNEDSLTVPEPGAAALGVAALAGLAACARAKGRARLAA